MHASLDNGHSKKMVSFIRNDNIATCIASASRDKVNNRSHLNDIKSFQIEAVMCMIAESIVTVNAYCQ